MNGHGNKRGRSHSSEDESSNKPFFRCWSLRELALKIQSNMPAPKKNPNEFKEPVREASRELFDFPFDDSSDSDDPEEECRRSFDTSILQPLARFCPLEANRLATCSAAGCPCALQKTYMNEQGGINVKQDVSYLIFDGPALTPTITGLAPWGVIFGLPYEFKWDFRRFRDLKLVVFIMCPHESMVIACNKDTMVYLYMCNSMSLRVMSNDIRVKWCPQLHQISRTSPEEGGDRGVCETNHSSDTRHIQMELYCFHGIELGNLKGFAHLQRMSMYCCSNMDEMVFSFFRSLRELTVDGCECLVNLVLTDTPLQTLRVDGCPQIRCIRRNYCVTLERVHISNCAELQSLEFFACAKLQKVDVYGCPGLWSLIACVNGTYSSKYCINHTISGCPSLRGFVQTNCCDSSDDSSDDSSESSEGSPSESLSSSGTDDSPEYQ